LRNGCGVGTRDKIVTRVEVQCVVSRHFLERLVAARQKMLAVPVAATSKPKLVGAGMCTAAVHLVVDEAELERLFATGARPGPALATARSVDGPGA